MVEKKLGVVEKMLWRLRKVSLFARFIRKKCKILADMEYNDYFCNRKVKIGEIIMDDMKFNNRLEQVQWYEQQQGWGPLTEEDKQALDEAVRMVTNL